MKEHKWEVIKHITKALISLQYLDEEFGKSERRSETRAFLLNAYRAHGHYVPTMSDSEMNLIHDALKGKKGAEHLRDKIRAEIIARTYGL